MKRLWVLTLVVILTSLRAAAQIDDPAYIVEKVVTANYPVAMAFAPDGRLFYTEKATGNVRVVNADGRLQPEPVITFAVDSLVERGLLGITLDPLYTENGLIWIVRTKPGTSADWPTNEVIRFTEKDGTGSAPEVMLSTPITTGNLIHNGGNLHFSADGLLYLSMGDYGEAANAQDLTMPQGKIHRFQVTTDGLIPAPDNPFPGSSIYAYGLRNPFDFTIDLETGAVYAAENGPKCDDEINRIVAGGNYGWGPAYGDRCYGMEAVNVPDYQMPMISFNPTIGMSGIALYDRLEIPQWQGNLLFCNWNEGALQRAVLDANRTRIVSLEPIDLQGFFCRIDVVVGPEGGIYFADPAGIYRLMPQS